MAAADGSSSMSTTPPKYQSPSSPCSSVTLGQSTYPSLYFDVIYPIQRQIPSTTTCSTLTSIDTTTALHHTSHNITFYSQPNLPITLSSISLTYDMMISLSNDIPLSSQFHVITTWDVDDINHPIISNIGSISMYPIPIYNIYTAISSELNTTTSPTTNIALNPCHTLTSTSITCDMTYHLPIPNTNWLTSDIAQLILSITLNQPIYDIISSTANIPTIESSSSSNWNESSSSIISNISDSTSSAMYIPSISSASSPSSSSLTLSPSHLILIITLISSFFLLFFLGFVIYRRYHNQVMYMNRNKIQKTIPSQLQQIHVIPIQHTNDEDRIKSVSHDGDMIKSVSQPIHPPPPVDPPTRSPSLSHHDDDDPPFVISPLIIFMNVTQMERGSDSSNDSR